MGEKLLSRTFGPVTRTDLVRYAGAGGDFNPIHHDDEFAIAAGYPSVFGHGLYTAGLAGAALGDAVGPLSLRRYAIRYVGQVWPGDTLTVVVEEASSDSDGRAFTMTVHACAEGAEPRLVLTGTAEADA